MRQEQQEKSLFLFVVVVGYVATSSVAIKGGTQYPFQPLLLGILFGVIYLTLRFLEMRFSCVSQQIYEMPHFWKRVFFDSGKLKYRTRIYVWQMTIANEGREVKACLEEQ